MGRGNHPFTPSFLEGAYEGKEGAHGANGHTLTNNDAVLGELIALGFNCAQCRGGPVTGSEAPTIKLKNGDSEVWVHDECRRFWVDDHSDLSIPGFLRRSQEPPQ